MLRGAAVAGDPFEPDLAAAAAGADDATAMAAFDELLDLGLVRPTDVPRRFRFRHPLVRRAVYESAPGGWLLGAHERCAQVLAERGAPAAARAHHVEFAARHGDLAAVAVLTRGRNGGDPPRPRQRRPVVQRRAAPACPTHAPAEQRVGLLLARARALAAQGRLAESHADLLESIALAPAEAVGLRVQLTTTCAGVERLLGRHEEAHARLVAGLDQLPDPAAADAISLMIELAIDALFRADPESVRDWATRALDAARELGERPLVAAAAAILTLGHAVAGSIAEAQAAYAEATALVAAMSDEELSARVDAAAYLCSAATLPRPLRRGRRARRARAQARPCRGPPAPDAAPGARGGALHARPARRGGRGARRRRRGGAAGRHHPEHGVDAAQPLTAVGRGRRPPERRSRWPRRRSSSRNGSTRASCRRGRRWWSRGRR